MVKVGDIVFAKTTDVYEGESQIRPGLVTRVFTEDDGEWAKGREILGLTLFGYGGTVEAIDMDKGTLDDKGEWEDGGWATTADGPDAAKTPAPVADAPASDTATAGQG